MESLLAITFFLQEQLTKELALKEKLLVILKTDTLYSG